MKHRYLRDYDISLLRPLIKQALETLLIRPTAAAAAALRQEEERRKKLSDLREEARCLRVSSKLEQSLLCNVDTLCECAMTFLRFQI